MPRRLDSSRRPVNFEKFGRLTGDKLNVVHLSEGQEQPHTHHAVGVALTLCAADQTPTADVAPLSDGDLTEGQIDALTAQYARNMGLA